MKILITGKTGQVGWELRRTLLPLGEILAIGRSQIDLAKPSELRGLINEIKPDIIVNAAAYTAVDKAEDEKDLAEKINSVCPEVLAVEAKKNSSLLVHYSTDYVFDGTAEEPYSEEDQPNPLNVYGTTKLNGELAIQSANPDFLIFRTSWVFSSRGQNFLRTILRLSQERDTLRVVDDQIGSPTWARFIAETTAHCIKQSINERRNEEFDSGVFHLTSSGEASWYQFAREIVRLSSDAGSPSKKKCDVKNIPTSEFPTPAKRPMNSRLSTNKVQTRYGIFLPSWEQSLNLCLGEIA